MRFFFSSILILLTLSLYAQQPEPVIGAPIDTLRTTEVEPVITQPAANKNPSDSSIVKVHSPRKATILSLVIPGAGQVYNRKNWWWKVPIIYGGGAALVYGAVFYQNQYKDFKQAYEFKALNPNTPTGNIRFDRYPDETTLLNIRNSYRDARDQCLIGIGLLYALQVVDAAVEAHFFEFNVSDNLSLNIQPQFGVSAGQTYSGIAFTMQLK